ncbi:MAG: AraC family transcriptional regulator [Clostridiales bacterium]|nr:AraC family transcriptional regulator [Clostridiales bacterium]
MSVINSFNDEYITYSHSIAEKPLQYSFSMHAHEHHEVYCFLSGSGNYIVEGTEYRLEPRRILIMRSNEAHMPKIDGDIPYERIAIHFKTKFVERLDPECRLLRPFFVRQLGRMNLYDKNRIRSGFIHDCLRRMAEVNGDYYEKKVLISSYFYNILCEIYRAFENYSQEDAGACASSISEIIDYINNNLSENLSLSHLEDRFFISKSHLLRLFKRATGSTVWDYITVKRVNLAHSMLCDGVGAAEAASACGFNDYSAFYKAYRRRFGFSPTENMRKQYIE